MTGSHEGHDSPCATVEGGTCASPDNDLDRILDRGQVLRLEPGDVLVFSNVGDVPQDQATALGDLLREHTPAAKVVMFDRDVDVAVLRGRVASPEGRV